MSGDEFASATSYLVVATKARDRWFDLDSVRTEHKPRWFTSEKAEQEVDGRGDAGAVMRHHAHPAGAPPLDWFLAAEVVDPEPMTPKTGVAMGTARFIVGDVLEQLRKLPDASVDLVLSSPPFLALRSYLPGDHRDKGKEIGSEPTPGEFLDVILEVVEECARVLTPHGSLVFEFGDTYAGGGQGPDAKHEGSLRPVAASHGPGWPMAKSLTLIPESFAWALAYGRNPWTGRTTDPWRIRNFCPWVRPNPPVGALGDKFRPGTSYLTVACKARDRWFDLDAVRQASVNPIGVGVRPTQARVNGADENDARGTLGPFTAEMQSAGAPPLDWFSIPTQPYPGAHYATWSEKLVLPFIESMCPRQVCNECGTPRRRITESERFVKGVAVKGGPSWSDGGVQGWKQDRDPSNGQNTQTVVTTLGWSDCGHDDWRPGVVLDPFGGSGTTGQVATGCGRDAILIDLDARNLELARERIGFFLVEEAPEEEPAA